MKTYTIGGKEFQLLPLTLRQRQLCSPVYRKIVSVLQKLVEAGNTGNILLSDAFSISIEIDSIVLAEEFQKFLATILTPVGQQWKLSYVEENAELMLEIDEATQAEVLQDFLSRQSGLTTASPGFMNIVPNAKPSSNENADSKE